VIAAQAFAGRRYAVLGLARSGLATVEALLASGAQVTAWDSDPERRAALGAGAAPGLALADLDRADLAAFDSLVLSPGVPLNRSALAARAREAEVEIIGDVELFARARADLPPHKVVGITGTNGKSTTTALVHHILQGAGVPSLMAGNIGLPILGADPLPAGGVYVLELSSYQLDLTDSLDCEVAVLLNITPDHLDRYDGFDAYAASKARLFAMQSPGRLAVVDRRAEADHGVLDEAEDPVIQFIDDVEPGEQAAWPALQGPHNRQNAAAAVAVCRELRLDEAVIADGLATFTGLRHRMERVRSRDGVLFVNDSKATNATATAPALAAFDAVRWILGGRAKAADLDECAAHFGHVRKAYTIGEASGLFAALLKPHMAVAECGTLDAAVAAAAADAAPGDTVLLSPACASFDQFSDFEARGDAFRAAVEAL
jgi:UDP-N-acetylmuramoylalanine--D-glutamate ligase